MQQNFASPEVPFFAMLTLGPAGTFVEQAAFILQ